MKRYLRMIEEQLKSYEKEIVVNLKELTNERVRYIHALDLYLKGKVINRIKYKDKINAIVDDKSVYIKFRDNTIARSYCQCNDSICEHILATLIALEREPLSFRDRGRDINKIINAYKMLMNDMLNSSLNSDRELLYAIRNMILSYNDRSAHHIIGLLLFGVLTNIDKKYNTNTLSMINNKVGECINTIIDAINNKEKHNKMGRSWDNIMNELLKVE